MLSYKDKFKRRPIYANRDLNKEFYLYWNGWIHYCSCCDKILKPPVTNYLTHMRSNKHSKNEELYGVNINFID